MPSSIRSNKETQLLFSSDPASLERSICKGRRSSSIDIDASSSIDTRQPPSTQTPILSTDTRSPPSTEATLPSTDIFHPTSIDTSIRTSIDTELRDMVATLVLVRDENGDMHNQEGHLGNTTGQRIDAHGTLDEFWRITLVSIDVRHRTSIDGLQPKPIGKLSRTSIDDTFRVGCIIRQPPSTHILILSTDTRSPPSTEATLPSTDFLHPTSIDTSSRTSINTEPRDMAATLVLVRDENGDLHDQEGHLRNAAGQKIDAQGTHEKLQEGDFELESSMSFGGSHWCRPTSDLGHRSMDFNQNRSTSFPEHRSTTPSKSVASCNAVRIMPHEDFAARHPHLWEPKFELSISV
ncbi:hypothetical protein F2Q70_00022679 [Brassica cretica]|uniref:Uncharacterized protein n=1 Tax=Brassica cretica TaxID=69181 RepID=A0A8S9GP40_BRACR|nr:hypothetical protein F2Q70_00022679 [Brassica cretica]